MPVFFAFSIEIMNKVVFSAFSEIFTHIFMLKYLTALIILSVFTISCNKKVALIDQDIVTLNGTIISKSILEQESVFFLVVSLHCGYCIRDISFYNELSKNSKKDIHFIALFEDDSSYINKYKANKKFLNDRWTVIPSAGFYYEKIWIKGLFPEYLIYENGELRKSFAFSNKLTRNHIKLYLNLFY